MMKCCYLTLVLLIAVSCESQPKPVQKHFEKTNAKEAQESITKDEEPIDTVSKVVRYYAHTYDNLSAQFTVKLKLKTIEAYYFEPWVWTVTVYDKNDSLIFKQVQEFSNMYLEVGFWSNVRSYETHYRETEVAGDRFYGYLVINDFNFDSLSDIALIANIPPTGSGTPSYEFYFQTDSNTFVRDAFFTDVVQTIPFKIDRRKRKFQTQYWFRTDYFSVDTIGRTKKTWSKVDDWYKGR